MAFVFQIGRDVLEKTKLAIAQVLSDMVLMENLLQKIPIDSSIAVTQNSEIQ